MLTETKRVFIEWQNRSEKMGINLYKNHTNRQSKETLDFFQNSAKWVAFGVIFGISISLLYSFFLPSKYLVSTSFDIKSDVINASNIDARQVFLLTQNLLRRDDRFIETCAFNKYPNKFFEKLEFKFEDSRKVKIKFNFFGADRQEAAACMGKVVEIFQNNQTKALRQAVNDKQRKISDIQEKINSLKLDIRTDTYNTIEAVVNYLIVRDELKSYKLEKSTLTNQVDLIQKMLANENVNPEIVIESANPSKKLFVLNGLFSGIILGLLIQLFISKHSFLKGHSRLSGP